MPDAKTLSRDTQPEAEAVQIDCYRRMPPWRKIELMEAANRTARLLTEAGVRARYPKAATAEIQRRVSDLWLGSALAGSVYGPLPSDESGTDLDGNI